MREVQEGLDLGMMSVEVSSSLKSWEWMRAAISGRKGQIRPMDRIFGILPLRDEKKSKKRVWAATTLQWLK